MSYPLGRLPAPDPRDHNFQLAALLPIDPTRRFRYYWSGWFGDQGETSSCVGFSWTGWLTAAPITQRSRDWQAHALWTYVEAQRLDEWEGEAYEGTSVRAGAKALQAQGFLSEYRWAFTADEVVRAILDVGPVVVGTNWTECVVPGTRVLTRGLEWVPVEKMTPGDEVIGFDEHARRSAVYQRSTVLTNDLLIRPCVEIITDRGTIVASVGHGFIECHTKAARHWTLAADLKPGARIAYMGDPWEWDRSWEAGWLAGFYDGEGCLSRASASTRCSYLLDCAQKPGPTADFAHAVLTAKGFDYRVKVNADTGVLHWYLRGPNVKLQFLGSIRPQRLLNVSERAWEGHATFNKAAPAAIVQDVRPIGDAEVYAIGTSTGTLITDGYLSHNSMFEPDAKGLVKPDGAVAGGHAYLLDGASLDRQLVRIKNSWGRDWGLAGRAYLSIPHLAHLMDQEGEAALATEIRL